ncbi:type IX secretion system protein PorQ [Chitinophaga defluvii]|uniref:Type IX secretion system protein PorQ n=1 Tax=Chitinophaga defluvii TaxID=3163343 RepID=A0ABV2TEG6_9BACT
MHIKHYLLTGCLFLLCTISATGQVLGGKHVFSFLDLPPAAQVTALGSVNVAQQNNDLSLTALNPALLRENMDMHLQVNYAAYFAGVKYGHGMIGYHASGLNTTFAASMQYVNYGQVTHTDAAGNILGTFTPRDFTVQVSASRRYLEKWYYGMTMKFVHSRYQQYVSSGIGADVGIAYQDTARLMQIAVVAKNMGVQLRTYAYQEQEPLPFDLQVGISQRLRHVPLQLSATIHHIYQFDVRYADPAWDNGAIINTANSAEGNNTFDKLFRHFVLAAQMEVGKYVELTASYNHLRRQELALDRQKGLSGFSAGIGVVTKKLQLRYARSWYQQATAFNQLGINIPLREWGIVPAPH